MFNNNLQIYDRIRKLVTDGDGLFLSDGFNLFKISEPEADSIINMKEYWGICFEKNGMWLNYDMHSKKSGSATFFDVYNKGIAFQDLPVEVNDRDCFFLDYYIGTDLDYIFCVSIVDGNIRKADGEFNLGVIVNNEKIYAVDIYEGLICFDMVLNEVWRTPFESNCVNKVFDGPQNYNNLIIINVGENEESFFEINAYSTEDGTLVWKATFEEGPYSSNVIGDKVYISVDKRIIILDAATGKPLLEKAHQFSRNTHHLLYPFNDKLIAISEPDSKIHVFDQEGNLKQQISMPEGYMPSIAGFPVEYDGKLYIDLTLKNMLMRGTSSVLVTLEPDESASETVNIELPPRPPFEIEVITNDNGEHEHVISISHDDLEEIILYATIILKETGKKTSDSVNMMHRDKKHNGILKLVVDSAPLQGETDLSDKLQIVKEKVEWYLKNETAGDNDNKYQVVIEMK